jgi:hypothetical protein
MNSLDVLRGLLPPSGEEEKERENDSLLRICHECSPFLSRLKREVVEEERRKELFQHTSLLHSLICFISQIARLHSSLSASSEGSFIS